MTADRPLVGSCLRQETRTKRESIERIARERKCQTACKPGSVPAFRQGTTIPLGRTSRRASRDQPGRQGGNALASPGRIFTRPGRRPPLFGLAPGGVCPAAPVARGAVRSCRTVSPLPAGNWGPCAGGLFSVALSLGSPPPAVSRHRISVEPGLSSSDAACAASGRPAVWPGGDARRGRQCQGHDSHSSCNDRIINYFKLSNNL